MTDHIRLTGVRAVGYHGVLPEERRDGQPFLVDVEIEADLSRAGTTDELGHTVDYGGVAAQVAAIVEGEPCRLIEAVAARIADAVLTSPLVEVVTVTVHKPEAPIPVPFTDVAVSVTRTRQRRG